MESRCGHDGPAAECAQDPKDGCCSVTRVEQVAMSFDSICVGTTAKYDPLFAATVPLVKEYATQIWEGRISPGTLVCAHKAWLQRRSFKPTWHGIHGPLGAVIMSLTRIDWSLEKGVAQRSDTDEHINMLQTPPRRVAALVERGITRWQMRDAPRSLAFDPSEAPDIWLRHMLHMLYSPNGLGQPAKVNMYFSMVTGGLICPSRMTALNFRTDPSCSFCGYAQGTFAHQWYACPGMFPIASRREHAPILPQARVAWDFDEADTSLFWSLGIPSVSHPSILVPGAQEVADWEAQDDTRQGPSWSSCRSVVAWVARAFSPETC